MLEQNKQWYSVVIVYNHAEKGAQRYCVLDVLFSAWSRRLFSGVRAETSLYTMKHEQPRINIPSSRTVEEGGGS